MSVKQPIWHSYLTPRDRELAARQPVLERGLGSHPALLLVDLYRNGFGTTREPLLDAVERWPMSCGEEAWDAVPHIQRLLQAARMARVPIIHITGLPDVPSWREGRTVVGRGSDVEQRREQFAIIPEVGPTDDELVLRKSAPSAFWGTILPGVLTQAGIDSLIVTGQSTSGCVRATVVDACSHRYRVVIPEECVFDRTQASHAINLFDMHQKYADVKSTDAVIQLLTVGSPG